MDASQNYNTWVDTYSKMSTSDRKKNIEEILGAIAQTSDEAQKIVESFTDPKEFEKISMLGYMHFVPLESCEPDKVAHLKFKTPVVAMKHKKLPIIMAMGKTLPDHCAFVSIDAAKPSMGVDQLLSYNKTLSKMSKAEKSHLFNLTIKGIQTYRDSKNAGKEWLSDYLVKNKDFTFKGFALNLPYINVDPAYGDTRSFWVHAWGTPQLLFSHKRLPVMIITGPSVRLDKNVLGDTNMTGYTG